MEELQELQKEYIDLVNQYKKVTDKYTELLDEQLKAPKPTIHGAVFSLNNDETIFLPLFSPIDSIDTGSIKPTNVQFTFSPEMMLKWLKDCTTAVNNE